MTQAYALEHACVYARLGWPVLPIKENKAPATLRGFKDASTDPETIRRWYEAMPDAGVAIFPGPAHLLVLDVDTKHGAQGPASLEQLEAANGRLPHTLCQKTPSGAYHLLYSVPAGFSAGNSTLAPGIDVRCSAGYVGAEPSRIRLDDGSYGTYLFDDWDVTSGEAPEIAMAPSWLLLRLATPSTESRAAKTVGGRPREQASALQVAELRSALNMLDASDYSTWVDTGNRLKSLGQVGRELWLTWSAQSDKFDPAQAAAKWETFNPLHTGFAAVFSAAQAVGWVNPASKVSRPVQAEHEPPLDVAEPSIRFSEVDVSGLEHSEPIPQAWWWDGYVPAGHVTLWGGHGGVGKSLLALMLAVSVAMGTKFLGKQTNPGSVLYFSAEDPGSLVRSRLARICRAWQIDASALSERLRIIDATDIDAALYSERRIAGVRAGATTPTYEALREYVNANAIDVLILDNASDVFDGDEIVRSLVRGFIRSLASLVRSNGGGVVLLAHVDKITSRAGKVAGSEGYSGSTAWNNSVRSRLLQLEVAIGMLELQHQKCNLGPKQKPVQLAWPEGQALPAMVEADATAQQHRSEPDEVRALVSLVRDYYRRGEWVSPSMQGSTSAARLFASEAAYPRHLRAAEVAQRLRTAERLGYLRRENYKGADRHVRERWAVLERGAGLVDGAGMFADSEDSLP